MSPRWSLERVRVDLGDDERDLGIAPERRRVVDHDRARLDEARRPLARGRAARREQRDVEALDRHRRRATAHRHAVDLAARPSARRRTGRSRRPGTARSRRSSSIVVPDRAGGADDGDTQAELIAPSSDRARAGPRRRRGSNALCSARTAWGTASARITHEILIGDVEIISMLMPSSASVSNTLAATPGMRAHPGADDRDLAHLLVGVDPLDAELADARLSAARPRRRSSRRDRERDLGARGPRSQRLVLDDHVDVELASASAVKIARRGARAVGHAEQRDPGLLGRVGDGGDQGVFHRLVFSEHKGTGARRRSSIGSGSARRGCGRTRPSAAAAPWRPRPPSRASPRS